MNAQRYPVDRTIFFSDAVFAIAMTLLILEIKIPGVDEFNQLGVGKLLVKRIPNFIGFIISFLVIALFWRAHLQLCSFVKTISTRFFWLNIGMLFFVVLLPFTTAIYSSYAYFSNLAFGLYCANIGLIGLFIYLLILHVIRTENLATEIKPKQLAWIKGRALVVPIVFLSCILLSLISPIISRWGFLAVFLIQFIGDRMNRSIEKTKDSTLPQ